MSKTINEMSQRDAYAKAGVDSAAKEEGLSGLLQLINRTFAFRPGVGRPVLPIGYFANVLDLGRGQGLAISTDGVGTKLLVAELLGRYDTIGIDCIAMNVNDLLCVGAEPIALVDYVAVQIARPEFLGELAKGLYAGAEQARIAIPGGEIAQVREIIRGLKPDEGFDLVGTAVGVVATDRIVIGQNVEPGDAVIGLASSGIHSNGLTLARDVLFHQAGYNVQTKVDALEHSLGDELLIPTRIYVRPVLAMLEALDIKALMNITSDGLLNLLRIQAAVGFVIDYLPEPLPIFRLIQKIGQLPDEQMYFVFNMGIGFCVVVPDAQASAALQIANDHGIEAWVLGRAVAEPNRTVQILPRQLEGHGSTLRRMAS